MEVQNQQFIDVGHFSPEKRRNSDDHGHSHLDVSADWASEIHDACSVAGEYSPENELQEYLQTHYIPIEIKLSSGEFKNHEQFESECLRFKTQWAENAPGCVSRSEKIFTFYLKHLIKGSKQFLDHVGGLEEILSFIKASDAELSELQKQSELYKSRFEEYESKIDLLETTVKQLQHSLLTSRNEFAKEKGLLEQKWENLETSLKETRQRELSLTQEIKDQRVGLLAKLKDKDADYDQKYQDLREKYEASVDKVTDLEAKLEEVNQLADWEKQKLKEAEGQVEELTNQKEHVVFEYNKMIDELKNQISESRSELKNEEELQKAKDKILNLEKDLVNASEEVKLLSANLEKQIALHNQKVFFYEAQLAESKIQQEESHKAHEALMKAFKSVEAEQNYSKDNVHEIMQQHRSEQFEEIKNLESKFTETKQRLTSQIEKLSEQNNALELELKIKTSELEKENEQLSQNIEELTSAKAKLEDALKQLETEKLHLIDTLEQQYREKIKKLESDLNCKSRQHQETVDEIRDEKDRQINQLKEFYEQEKQRLEARILEEKKNNQIRLDHQQEEHEEQLKEEQEMHEGEVEMLQEDLKHMEARLMEANKQAEQEIAICMQKIAFLEESLKDAKDTLNECQKNSAATLDKQLERFAKERTTIKVSLEKEFEKKKQEFDCDKQELREKLESLYQEIDQVHQTNQDLKDELIKQKLDFTREEAIINQKLKFKDEKIQELSEANEFLAQQSEEKLKHLRIELLGEVEDKMTKLETENSRLNDRYEQKRKAAKDLENDFNKLKAEKDRESIILEQKIFNLDSAYKKLSEKYEKEVIQLKDEYATKIEQLETEIAEVDNENNDLKTRLLDAERDFSEIKSNYDRDQALWLDKCEFLEQQKQQAKRDLQDAHKKFEMTVEQLRRKDSSDRGKSESAQLWLINSIEKKYKDQIKDVTDSYEQMIQELTYKYKQLDKDYKDLTERYEIENRGKISEHGSMEKKLRDLLENEHLLQEEIKKLKVERDRRCLENQASLEREKEIYKQRLAEIELKAKNSETKKSSMMFEFEKERAKWALEKDKLQNDIETLTENLKIMKRKKETLQRDNEKYKNEVKARGRFNHASTMGPSITNGVLATRQIDLAKGDSMKIPGPNFIKSPTFNQKFIGDFSTMKSKRSSQNLD